MSLNVSLHDIRRATVNVFQSQGETVGSVRITCDRAESITLYTTPARAQAIADAVNAVEGGADE